MRRVAVVLTTVLALHAGPAFAGNDEGFKASVVNRPARCLRGPLSGLNEVKACWLPLLRTCKHWDANRMVGIVWRESSGWPKAYNKTPVGRQRLHAYGLVQRLGEHSTDPRVQVRNGCELAKNARKAKRRNGTKGHWSDPWKATR